MKREEIVSFLEVSTGAKVKSIQEKGEDYLFTLSEPKGELYPPRFAEVLFIDFDKREAAFVERKESLLREIELQKISER